MNIHSGRAKEAVGEEMPRRSPARIIPITIKILQTAAERVGVKAENILFVGDRIDKDILGAVKAGMIPALKAAYTNAGKKVPPGVYKIDTIAQLPELVRKIHNEKETASQEHSHTPISAQT